MTELDDKRVAMDLSNGGCAIHGFLPCFLSVYFVTTDRLPPGENTVPLAADPNPVFVCPSRVSHSFALFPWSTNSPSSDCH